jgi:hypothetical protein
LIGEFFGDSLAKRPGRKAIGLSQPSDLKRGAQISPRHLRTRDHPHTSDPNPTIRSTLSILSHTGRTILDRRRPFLLLPPAVRTPTINPGRCYTIGRSADLLLPLAANQEEQNALAVAPSIHCDAMTRPRVLAGTI